LAIDSGETKMEESRPEQQWKSAVYRLALGLTLAFGVCQMIALPLTLTFDGNLYIDSGDILGSASFPESVLATAGFTTRALGCCWGRKLDRS